MSKPRRIEDPTAGHLATELRIVGGTFRGRRLLYHGDQVTRPMKHRVRESIFNLVSLGAQGKHTIDLFAGTGALGLEALSRGAATALFIERHIPTALVVRENIERLEVQDRCELLETSAFVWVKRDLPKLETPNPWLVFISPPYSFFVDRQAEMIEVITQFMERAPADSIIVVETDERFDYELLPAGPKADRYDTGWDVRTYAPAVVGIWRKDETGGFSN